MEDIRRTLAEEVSRLTGLNIGEDHVHNDEAGWYYYIPAKALHSNYPLLMCHYRGPYFIVIPTSDWKSMSNGEKDPKEYVNEAVWSYGRYWGGGFMLGGVHWQPLEDGKPGITDKEKIKRYMTILSCRTHLCSCGYMPTWCESCFVQSCPFSKNEEKKIGASWENEVEEKDDRIKLYNAFSLYLLKRFDVRTSDCCLYSNGDKVRIFPGVLQKNDVEVYFPQDLMIDMLYHPGKYDIDKLIDGMAIEAGTHWYYNQNGDFVPCEYTLIPEDADAEMLYDVWRDDIFFKQYLVRETSEDEAEEEVQTVPNESDDKRNISLVERLTSFLRKFFK